MFTLNESVKTLLNIDWLIVYLTYNLSQIFYIIFLKAGKTYLGIYGPYKHTYYSGTYLRYKWIATSAWRFSWAI